MLTSLMPYMLPHFLFSLSHLFVASFHQRVVEQDAYNIVHGPRDSVYLINQRDEKIQIETGDDDMDDDDSDDDDNNEGWSEVYESEEEDNMLLSSSSPYSELRGSRSYTYSVAGTSDYRCRVRMRKRRLCKCVYAFMFCLLVIGQYSFF
jgi:hypothetical protein